MSEDYWRRLLAENGKLYRKNVNSIKSILKENKGCVGEIPYDETVILLFSGGMDSVILIDVVIREWNCKVILLYYRRNSKNQKWEEEAVDFFYDFYRERYPQNLIDLIKLEIEIPSRINKKYLDSTRQKIMGLPLRNSTMWDNAFAQAVYLSSKYKTTIRSVLVGSVKEDETSPESGILAILSYTLHACIAMSVWYYQLQAPFIDGNLDKVYNKVDLLKIAKNHQIPIERSRSCFGKDQTPCNSCLACENRNNAYAQFSDMKEKELVS